METEQNGSITDPMEEVRKLQDLVKHLEQQNQQLRKKQIVSDNVNKEATHAGKSKLHVNGRTECENGRVREHLIVEKRDRRNSGSLDEVGLINIDDLELDDEASWLYMSPKKSPTEDPTVTKWLRKDLEDPRNKELQLARRALAYKLDELAILNPSNDPQNIFGSPDFGNPPLTKNAFGRIIDSRTFTRGKKKLTTYGDLDSMPVIEAGEYEDEPPAPSRSIAPLQPAAAPRVPPMTDVIDVQEIARMQEESLRQSSPCSTPRRLTMSRKWSSSSKNSSISDIEGQDGVLPLTTENLSRERQQSNHRVYQDTCSNSTHSSPPESFHGSNNSLDTPNDSFHQSMPNLAKGFNGLVGHQNKPRPLNQVAAINGSHHPPPPRSLALQSRLSSLSPAKNGRSMGLPSRSVGNLQQQNQSSSMPSRRMPSKTGSPLANGLPPSCPIAPVAPSRVTSPSRRVMSPPRRVLSPPRRVLSPPSKPRLQSPSSGQHQAGKSSLPVPRYSKIPSPKPRSGIPVPSSQQHSNNSVANDELWSDGCY